MSLYDLIDWYLLNSGGDRWRFREELEKPHIRPGQSFFNCLSKEDQERLHGTPFDTFYAPEDHASSKTAILFALDFLTR